MGELVNRLRKIAIGDIKNVLDEELNIVGLETYLEVDRWEWKARLDNLVISMSSHSLSDSELQNLFIEIGLNALLGHMVTQYRIEVEEGMEQAASEEEEEESEKGADNRRYMLIPVTVQGNDLEKIEVGSKQEACEMAQAIWGTGTLHTYAGIEFIYSPYQLAYCRIEPIPEE